MSEPDLLAQAVEAQQRVVEVEQLRREALAQRRQVLLAAKEAGLSYRQIGKHLGITGGRVLRTAEGNRPKNKKAKLTPVEL